MKNFYNLFIIFSLGLFTACGGGSHNDNQKSSSCDVLSLKVYNGDTCSNNGPIAKITGDITSISGEKFTANCTGIVIGKRHVLTAAHCLFSSTTGDPVDNFVIDLGNQVFTEATGGIEEIYFPELYFKKNPLYDYAIFELNNDIKDITPITFLSSEKVQPDEKLTVFGYGLTGTGELGILKAGSVRVTNDTTSDFIHCVATEALQAPCGGDSGGPLIAVRGNESFLVGIVSHGSTELSPNDYCGSRNFYSNLQTEKTLRDFIEIVPDISIR